MLWHILVQFLFRLAFGLTATMACTSPRWVTAGFYRVHLWVGLGLNTFIAGIVYLLPEFQNRHAVMGVAIAAGVVSYVGAVVWLYEKKRAGQVMLVVVALTNLVGAVLASRAPGGSFPDGIFSVSWSVLADTLTASMLLGTTLTAMLLGHWYLNTPTMQLQPLKRLVILMAAAVVLRAVVAASGLGVLFHSGEAVESTQYAFLALRWLAGLAGVLGLAAMTWQTLKIPNTQSATGILYVAVIFTFLGELTSQLMLVQAPYLL